MVAPEVVVDHLGDPGRAVGLHLGDRPHGVGPLGVGGTGTGVGRPRRTPARQRHARAQHAHVDPAPGPPPHGCGRYPGPLTRSGDPAPARRRDARRRGRPFARRRSRRAVGVLAAPPVVVTARAARTGGPACDRPARAAQGGSGPQGGQGGGDEEAHADGQAGLVDVEVGLVQVEVGAGLVRAAARRGGPARRGPVRGTRRSPRRPGSARPPAAPPGPTAASTPWRSSPTDAASLTTGGTPWTYDTVDPGARRRHHLGDEPPHQLAGAVPGLPAEHPDRAPQHAVAGDGVGRHARLAPPPTPATCPPGGRRGGPAGRAPR